MQSNQIKDWVNANKLLSAIIAGVILVAIILYSGANKQVPEAKEQPEEAIMETPGGEAAAPETTPEEAPPAETAEEVPPEEPVGTEETTQGGTT